MPSPQVRVRWILLGFVLLTALVFRSTPFELAHTAPVLEGTIADGVLYAWAIGHVSKTLLRPWAIFDGGMFHPAADTLAFSDHMIGQALLGLPVWFLSLSSPFEGEPVGNALLEFNLLVLASYALGATAAFVYARTLVGSTAAAIAAGIAFVFTPLRFRSPHYIQTLITIFVPLTLLAWLRFVERPSHRWWIWWVVAWWAHSLMGMYATIYFGILMGILALWALVASPNRGDRRLWIGTVLAPFALLILLAPTLWPYVRARDALGLERTGGFETRWAMMLPALGTTGGELLSVLQPHQFGPGLVVWGLVALGFVVGRRSRPAEILPRRFLWQVNLLGLATLTTLMVLPLSWTQRIPGLDLMRTTHRPFFLALLFVAYFVAEGVAWAEARMPSGRVRSAAGAALVLLVALDMGTPLRERRQLPVHGDLPQIYRQVRALPEPVVYDDPGVVEGGALALYYSLFHGKRSAGGYSGFAGPWGEYAVGRYRVFPADEATALLWDVGVRHVVKHYPTVVLAEQSSHYVDPATLRVVTQIDETLLFKIVARPAPLPSDPVELLPRARWSVRASDDFRAIEALRDGSAATSAIVRLADPPTSWIVVDAGEPTPLAGVRVTPVSPDDSTIYLARIELSVDGDTWEPPRTWFEPDDREALLEHPGDVRFFEARFTPTTARWVRLTNPRARFRPARWEIGELDLLTTR